MPSQTTQQPVAYKMQQESENAHFTRDSKA